MPKQTPDAFSQFMATAARYPLLTHLEEVELAQKVRAWLDAEAPSPATIAAGQRARERLICCNLRLIIFFSKKYRNRGLDMADLVQEATIGLQRAANKFNPAKGQRFSTYASWWIKQSMGRGIEEYAKAIRLPNHIHELLRAAKKTAFDYRMANGRYPTTEELGLALIEAGKLQPPAHKKGEDPIAAAIKKFDRILAISRDVRSLDFAVQNIKDASAPVEIGNIVECHRPRPEAVAAERDQRMFTEELLRTLPAKHRAVLVARYGLDGNPPQPYAKIGEAMNMGTRSAKTMHDRAIRNLRAKVGDSDFVELLRGA